MRWIRTFTLLLMAAMLAGCASVRRIDADVLSISAAPAGMNLQGARYRFERLPSQANDPLALLVEQHAQSALGLAGLERDDANAQISVLVGVRASEYMLDPWGRAVPPVWAPYGSLVWGRGIYPHWGVGLSMRLPPPTTYRREVSLLLRDLRTGQVVYETRAAHDGPWSDDQNVLPALFRAALAGFPAPPGGSRKVIIDIPR
jgi:Domain of unknown function (DUF4136)